MADRRVPCYVRAEFPQMFRRPFMVVEPGWSAPPEALTPDGVAVELLSIGALMDENGVEAVEYLYQPKVNGA